MTGLQRLLVALGAAPVAPEQVPTSAPDPAPAIADLEEKYQREITLMAGELAHAREHYQAGLAAMNEHVGMLERDLAELRTADRLDTDAKLRNEIEAQREVIARLKHAPRDAGRRELLREIETATRLHCEVHRLTEASAAADKARFELAGEAS